MVISPCAKSADLDGMEQFLYHENSINNQILKKEVEPNWRL